jgi:hypothetical protein
LAPASIPFNTFPVVVAPPFALLQAIARSRGWLDSILSGEAASGRLRDQGGAAREKSQPRNEPKDIFQRVH